ARVTIQNYYQYRHVDKPGWELGWTWAKNEVIWSMAGAIATQQGNCSSFKSQIPHTCRRDPLVVDLMPDAAPENKSGGCCHGGLVGAYAINPLKSFSFFEITVGNLESNTPGYKPLNLTLMAPGPGYTCGLLVDTNPTVWSVIGGRREEQTFSKYFTAKFIGRGNQHAHTLVTWLTGHQFVVFRSQHFTILPLHHALSAAVDAKEQNKIQHHALGAPCFFFVISSFEKTEDYISTQSGFLSNPDIVKCTNHMCPLQVHWHFKNNYRDHWRVKLTISNYNYKRNYTDWNVLVQHPGFSQSVTTFSFNSTMLPTVGITDEVALFWGIEYYNHELSNANERQLGSVTTEILLKKDSKSFTLSNGWAFPRRIYFNGESCQMPLPDTFPMLPNGSSNRKPVHRYFILPFLIYLTFKTLVVWL
ncbi:hypothetical protein HYC85_009546, partial [Camellia sinensis]